MSQAATSTANANANANAGLRDVPAAPSSICWIDGDEGILSYRGYNIHDLATHCSFEEVIYLLWYGKLPNQSQLDELKGKLNANMSAPPEVLGLMMAFPQNAVPMAALRTAVSALAFYDPETNDKSFEASQRKAMRLMGQTATLVAAFDNIRNGRTPLAPRSDLSFAANFLYMLTGKEPDDISERAFDIALTLHADHEFNASTFAARVTAATLADIYASVTSGMAALSGPLHGGANEQVMRMLLDVGTVEGAENWIRTKLANKEKVMGFGHAVYRTEDPRATHLRRMSEEIGKRQGNTQWFDMSKRIETIVKEEKGLNANVDFYSASTYYQLGIALDLYTPIFGVSRMSGWTAHVLEQYSNNKLLRPRSDYQGELGLTFVPMDKR
ncbi:MAG: citrate synthase [Acidobacteria bacterium]|nr:citrate synthase [Acidobacteriota bacterium]